ncbi:MAG: alcohol dehydrogenase catalytic domain-containing protein [Clostridia bacterium]
MRAAVLYGKHDIRIEELTVPEVSGDWRLVKVAFCGICGTDVHLFEGDEGSVKLVPGTVPGHELSGTLFGTGEKVVVDPNYFCGSCSRCLEGNTHYCKNIFNTGVTVNGGFAEYVAAHKSQLHLVPEHVPLEDAAYAEPISCCLHGADLARIEPGDRVLITGGGTIGLIMLQICRHMGAAHIAVSEPMDTKRTLALSLGADSVFDSSIIDSEKLKKCDFNKVMECSGNPDAVRTAIECCKSTGTVMLFGLTKPDDEIRIKPFELFKRELTIKASYINPGTMSGALDLLAAGKIKTAPLTGGFITLEELPGTLAKSSEALKNGKILVKF